MKIKWLGHACFVISSGKGVKILTDPYYRDAHLSYPPINDHVNIITVSHDHHDHSDVASVQGTPVVLKGDIGTVVRDVAIRSVVTWHDEMKGKKRGMNHAFCILVDNVNICHLGDLGHQLADGDIAAIGEVDVLLIPIGGIFTIDVDGANSVCRQIKPKVVIPMHYRTDRCEWLKFGAEEFITGKANARRLDSSEIELTAASLPHEQEIIVLQYAV